MKIDMHVHTNASHDSPNTIEDIEKEALKKGLCGVAICNHNTFVEYKSQKIIIIPAAEYSTDAGHILVYFLKSDIGKVCSKNKQGLFLWQDIVKKAHNEGALCFLAHPFAPKKERPEELFSQIDGIEVINAKSAYAKAKNCNLLAQNLCEKYNLCFCGGSDAHFKSEVGSSYTQFDVLNYEQIKQCLNNKNCTVVYNNISPFYKPVRQTFFYLKKKRLKLAIKAFLRIFLAVKICLENRKEQNSFERSI